MHAAALPLALSFLLAASYSYAETFSSRVSSLESRMTAVKNDTIYHTAGAKMASASPLIDGFGFFATADLLVWHIEEGGSDYALSYKGPSSSGKVKHSDFDWDFGFRTGVGYNLEHDAWDWYLNFTWFQADATNTAHAPKSGSLTSQKGILGIDSATKIQAHWNVHYYVLDLEVGRRYFVSKFLAFRPQFGIESAWICQRRRYSAQEDIAGVFGENIYGKNNFWGVGPRAGIEGTWYFGRHFSVMGGLSGALQWGHFDSHLTETELSSGGKTRLVDVDGSFYGLVPNAQMALGLSWDANINENKNHLGIRLSYEFQYWWRQNQFLNEQQSTSANFQHESMDLSLNGVTLDVRFDF